MSSKPTAIRHFDAMDGDSLGLQNAGFNEYDKATINTHQLNFDPSKKSKDQNNIQMIDDTILSEYKSKADLRIAEHSCFVANTKILTNNGYKDIQDVDLNDLLLTHTGKFQQINNLQQKVTSNNLYNFKIKYHPNIIISTPEHPFYIREKIPINSKTKKTSHSFGEPKWKHAKDISQNDLFGMIINNNQIIPELSLSKNKIILDKPEYWFLIGYFIGSNGWITNNSIYFNILENDDMDYIFFKIKTVTQIYFHTKNKYNTTFISNDLVMIELIKKLLNHSNEFTITEWIHDAPVPLLEQFIEGYQKSQAYSIKNYYTTTSLNIALGLQRLYLKLGKILSVLITKYSQSNPYNQVNYQIEGFINPKKQNKFCFIENNYAWYSSRYIISNQSLNEKVYNFEVANDNSYIVENTIVHNCQNLS